MLDHCLFATATLSARKNRRNLAQNEKIIQLLLAYPVHQYTMQHMLERCLVMIFSSPQLNLLPLGAFYLQSQGTFSLTAHRGINDLLQQKESELFSFLSLADLTQKNCAFSHSLNHTLLP